MIGHARVEFNDPRRLEERGVFSVEPNGWVARWHTDNPQVIQVMYPPHTVRRVIFEAPEVSR